MWRWGVLLPLLGHGRWLCGFGRFLLPPRPRAVVGWLAGHVALGGTFSTLGHAGVGRFLDSLSATIFPKVRLASWPCGVGRSLVPSATGADGATLGGSFSPSLPLALGGSFSLSRPKTSPKVKLASWLCDVGRFLSPFSVAGAQCVVCCCLILALFLTFVRLREFAA